MEPKIKNKTKKSSSNQTSFLSSLGGRNFFTRFSFTGRAIEAKRIFLATKTSRKNPNFPKIRK